MTYCENCGNQVAGGVKFCTLCGAATAAAETATTPSVQTAQPADRLQEEIYREEPVSTGGYFGILFVLAVPLLNLLLLIIWACGGCRKVNKRNFARAVLLWLIVGGILSVLILLVGGLLFGDELNALKEAVMNLNGITK